MILGSLSLIHLFTYQVSYFINPKNRQILDENIRIFVSSKISSKKETNILLCFYTLVLPA